ncbi:MAG TPA: nuclear transport factor 2 family protein [Bacteroidales bacterium]|nr:nuclear transport factor 2 family protein [Bacteroidales bacterium]
MNKDKVLADSLLQMNENAYNSGDAQIIANMFTDDALLIGNGKNTWTKDSILTWAQSLVPYIKNFKAYLGPTSVSADMVIMQKYWTLDYVVQGSVLPTKSVSILIWKKQSDNSWKTILEKSDYDIKTY